MGEQTDSQGQTQVRPKMQNKNNFSADFEWPKGEKLAFTFVQIWAQSNSKLSQAIASKRKSWPNGVASYHRNFSTCEHLRLRLARALETVLLARLSFNTGSKSLCILDISELPSKWLYWRIFIDSKLNMRTQNSKFVNWGISLGECPVLPNCPVLVGAYGVTCDVLTNCARETFWIISWRSPRKFSKNFNVCKC